MRPDDTSRGPGPGGPAGARTAQLGIVRLALLVGVLLFGAVTWWITRDRGPLSGAGGGPGDVTLRALRLGAPALAVLVVAAAAAIRAVIARTSDPARVGSLRVMAWALGETPALLGGAYWLLSGDPSRYTIGLVALVATFVIVPLRAR